MITVKRKTSLIRLPIRLPIQFNRIPPKKEKKKEELININKFGVLGMTFSQDGMNETTTPSILPTMPLFSRYYLPSKSLYSYNTDTGVQKDDYLDYVDTELKALEA